jgi:hypothetical protein
MCSRMRSAVMGLEVGLSIGFVIFGGCADWSTCKTKIYDLVLLGII